MRSSLKEWGAFVLLGLIWGSAFLWIKVAVREIGPFVLVALRLTISSLGLLTLLVGLKGTLPRSPRLIATYIFMGVLNTAIPFVLISWGEMHIDSGLASVLNSTMPLFTLVIAHFWLHDEKLTLRRLAGLVVGFVGVVVLLSRDLGQALGLANIWGQVAVILGAVCYAAAVVFSRRYLRNQPPVTQATMVIVSACGCLWLAAPVAEWPLRLPALPLTWLAIVWLGLLCSCISHVIYFSLLNAWGPTRTALTVYVSPVVAVVLGALFLREAVDWRLVAGALLVMGGIVVTNLKGSAAPDNLPVAAD